MRRTARFASIERDPLFGELSRMPDVSLRLTANGRTLSVAALLDTGATVNVLRTEPLPSLRAFSAK